MKPHQDPSVLELNAPDLPLGARPNGLFGRELRPKVKEHSEDLFGCGHDTEVAFVGTDAKLGVGEPRGEMLGVFGGHDAVGVALPEPYRDGDVSEAEAPVAAELDEAEDRSYGVMACADEDVIDEHCFHVGLGEHWFRRRRGSAP